MRYLSLLVLLWSLAASAAFPVQSTLCLGDSITEGGPILNGSPNWCEQIQTTYKNSIYKFSATNAGIGGATASDALTRWSTYRHHGYTRIIIFIGTNDLAQGRSAADIFADITTIKSQALADGMDVVVTTILPRLGSANWDGTKQSELLALNLFIMAISDSQVVDLYTAMEGVTGTLNATYDSNDHLHPNAAGHTAIFVTILSGVTWF